MNTIGDGSKIRVWVLVRGRYESIRN